MSHNNRSFFSITGRVTLLLTLLLTVTGMPAMAADHILHVNHAATGTNDGSSWDDAYIDLQTALSAAGSGDEIWVAAGVYKPVVPSDPENVAPTERQATFQLKNGVALYGGFAGGETARDQRDWLTHITVLSGDIDNNDTTDANGVVVNADDIDGSNSFHVVTGSGTDGTAILDGFAITAGLANDSTPDDRGGGMYNNSGSPTLTNVSFTGNDAELGGGMKNENSSSPTLTNVSFSGNNAVDAGGGMRNLGGGPTLTNVSFSGNNADNNGGGMHNRLSSPILTNVSFSGNNASNNGGGMFSTFFSTPTLTNVSFSGNNAVNNGGGMANGTNSNPVIRNTIFWNNRAGGVTGTAAASIFNFVPGDFSVPSIPQISYSLVQGCNDGGSWNGACGTDGDNNLADADPLFVNTPDPAAAPTIAGNLRLRPRSPGVDAGNNDHITEVDFDLDGNPRLFGPAVDVGAFEIEYLKIDLEIIGQGSVDVDPDPLRYDSGELVVLIATADPNWGFDGWSGDIGTTENPAALFMTADRNITATFAIDTYDISTSADPEGGGIVVCDPNPVDHGTDSTCTATANPGFAFTEWSGDCAGTDQGCVLESVTEPKSVTASFEQVGFAIEVSVEPAGAGSAQCDPNPVPEGEDSTCAAEPAPGFEFTGWSGDCEGETCELTNVTEEKAVTANFAVLDPIFQDRFEQDQSIP